mmetsp:Transcript_3521/g.11809  ORF Transcript_3521/g.11809 Transcript_3521/m.11809 type:complete len:220 (-) Transcript_3521:216-875(-)
MRAFFVKRRRLISVIRRRTRVHDANFSRFTTIVFRLLCESSVSRAYRTQHVLCSEHVRRHAKSNHVLLGDVERRSHFRHGCQMKHKSHIIRHCPSHILVRLHVALDELKCTILLRILCEIQSRLGASGQIIQHAHAKPEFEQLRDDGGTDKPSAASDECPRRITTVILHHLRHRARRIKLTHARVPTRIPTLQTRRFGPRLLRHPAILPRRAPIEHHAL